MALEFTEAGYARCPRMGTIASDPILGYRAQPEAHHFDDYGEIRIKLYHIPTILGSEGIVEARRI